MAVAVAVCVSVGVLVGVSVKVGVKVSVDVGVGVSDMAGGRGVSLGWLVLVACEVAVWLPVLISNEQANVDRIRTRIGRTSLIL